MKNTKIISVITEKGGVGKTTTSFNLGCALGAAGYSVLLIDLDKQGNLSTDCGYISSDGKRTISDVIYNAATGYSNDYEQVVRVSENNPNVSYIPAGYMLNASNSIIASCSDCNFVLRGILHDEFFLQYDYIIIDNKTDLDLLAQNALNATQFVIIPLDGIHGFDAIDNMMDKIRSLSETTNPELRVIGLLQNKVTNTNTNKEIDSACREIYGELVFNTKIPNRPEQVNKTIKCCTGCVNLKDNTLGDVYRELAAEVVERCTENEAKQTANGSEIF